jgi:3-oxoacyl-[acyl-carrier-protein] synthase-3
VDTGYNQADSYIKSGLAKRCLVIGADTLSRVIDKHDRDCMIFADGAGATIIEALEEDEKRGVISTAGMSHTVNEAFYLYFGKSYHPESDPKIRYIKMEGRKIYEYSLINVPVAMKVAMDKSGIDPKELKKVIIHQANEKMDEAIVSRFIRQCKIDKPTTDLMPMSIKSWGIALWQQSPPYTTLFSKEKFPITALQKAM